ncbi:MAG: peptide-methionine (R)-S-oxide reductase MsrB [Candidatus Woesearchaeota archaeon]
MNYEDIAKQKLTKKEYDILINKGTEPPFSGEYDDFFEKGTYNCKLCGFELFNSEDKFDSGCGWPSFAKAKNVELKKDYSHNMIRTEVICKNCKGHLGHVFDDGPKPTGKIYCINSLSIDFSK